MTIQPITMEEFKANNEIMILEALKNPAITQIATNVKVLSLAENNSDQFVDKVYEEDARVYVVDRKFMKTKVFVGTNYFGYLEDNKYSGKEETCKGGFPTTNAMPFQMALDGRNAGNHLVMVDHYLTV